MPSDIYMEGFNAGFMIASSLWTIGVVFYFIGRKNAKDDLPTKSETSDSNSASSTKL